jgi:hypothetical protein
MSGNKIEIIIAARDMATGVFNSISESTRLYHKTLHDLNGITSQTSASIRNMLLSFGGYGVIRNTVAAGYQFNSQMEESRVGLASLIYSMQEFKDANGAVVTGQQAFTEALSLSVGVQNQLRIAGIKTSATYEQLLKAYTQSYVPALKAGFDETMVVNFSTAVVQAATAMRVPLDMLGEEVRSILSGNMTPRTTMLQPLMEAAGMTNEKIRQLNAEGKLYPAVMKALEGATVGAAEASKNLSVQLSNLKDAAAQAIGKGMEIGFQKTKGLIEDLTKSIVTFDDKTGDMQWNDNLIDALRTADEKIFSIVDGIRDLGRAIGEFTTNHPALTAIIAGFGSISAQIILTTTALRITGGMFVWLKAVSAANIVFITSLFGPLVAAIRSITIASVAAGGALSVFGAFAGLAGAAMAGWKLGQYISQMEIMGLTIGEAMQAGYASIAKFGAYAIYTWDMIGATAKSVWGQVKEAGRILFYEFIAIIQESFPKMAQFFGLTDDYRQKADSARSAQSAIYQDFIKNQTAAEIKLKQGLSIQELIREGIFAEADARGKAAAAAAKGSSNLDKEMKKGATAATEYSLTHSAVNAALDRMSDILRSVKTDVIEFASEIKKMTATSHDVKLIDIEAAYQKDMAAVEKYKNDMDRAVRELQEKIAKAQTDATEKNAKRDVKDPITAVDPALHTDLKKKLAEQKELDANLEILRKQAREKRDIAISQENSGSLASVRSFVAAQTQEYTQLTGNVRAGYKAEADALRAKLAEELADVKKSAEEKAAITLLYNEKIRQAEVVKPAEYDRAAREAEIKNRLASLDLIEAEGTAHRNTINERIRLTEELISLQRQSLAAMPKAGNEQAWYAQADAIRAVQAALAALAKEAAGADPFASARLALAEMNQEWTDTGRQMYNVAKSTAESMEQAFGDFFFDAINGKLKSFGDYLNSFLQSVQRSLANVLAQQASAGISAGITGIVKTLFPASAGMGGVSGGMATAGGYAGGSFSGFHGGGEVGGKPSFWRVVPNFDLLPRRHGGGLAPDERMVINKVGERYITEEQNAWLTAIANRTSGETGAAKNVTVRVINESSQPMRAREASVDFNAQEMIVTLWMDAADRNAYGLRNYLGG